jgi:hypothetical protein
MDWYTRLEQRRSAAIFALLLLMIAILAVTSIRDPMAYDGYWHLKMGQDWVESGLSPWEDHLSYTFSGSKINLPSFVFDRGLYMLVDWLGLETGFKTYKFTSMLLVLIMTVVWLYRNKSPVLVYCLVLPLLVASLQFRATVRPELISYSLLILSLLLYERARSGVTVRNMLPIVALMLLWSNYHSSVFGFIVFFGLFIDLGLKQFVGNVPASKWVQWLAWGILIGAVGFLNPSLSHHAWEILFFPEEWKTLTQEYQSPIMYMNVPALYPLILVAGFTLLMLIRQRQVGYSIVCAIFLSQAFFMARIVGPAGVLTLCLFAYCLSRMELKTLITGRSLFRRRSLASLSFLLFGVTLFSVVENARAFVFQNWGLIGYFPAELTSYMKDNGRKGRIYNDLEIGGYLGYHLYPENRVYIDGRTLILYTLDFYKHYLVTQKSADALKAEFEHYDVQHAAIRNTAHKSRMIHETGMMTLDFADVRYFLYSRGETNFPVTGMLWGRPYCWGEDKAEIIGGEQTIARFLLPPLSPLFPFLSIMTDYTAAEDKDAYLVENSKPDEWTDPVKRFAAYRALDDDLNDLAVELFESVSVKEPKDYLGGALAHLHAGRPAETEKLIDEAMRINWDTLEFSDVMLLHGLLVETNEVKPLELFEPDYIEVLAGQVADFSLPAAGTRVSVAEFCSIED